MNSFGICTRSKTKGARRPFVTPSEKMAYVIAQASIGQLTNQLNENRNLFGLKPSLELRSCLFHTHDKWILDLLHTSVIIWHVANDLIKRVIFASSRLYGQNTNIF